MNKWLKVLGTFGIVAIVSAILVGAVAFAQTGQGNFGFRGDPGFDRAGFSEDGFFAEGDGPRHGGPGHRGGVGGEVTAVDDNSLTIENRNGESVTINITGDTQVMIAETQSEGSLDDIQVGSNVRVMGRPNEENGPIEARNILVLPAGDMAGGRVTTVEGSTITAENPKDGTVTIVANDSTQFRLGKDGEGSLADVTTDKGVMAFGEIQEDGSLTARIVFIHEGPGPGGDHGPREGHAGGEITSVEGTSFKIDPFRGDTEITVLTDVSTEYRTRDDGDVSFEDIQVGRQVMVKGQPVEGQENTIQAEVVGIKLDE